MHVLALLTATDMCALARIKRTSTNDEETENENRERKEKTSKFYEKIIQSSDVSLSCLNL